MWRVDKDGPAYATLYDGDRYVGCVVAADAVRIVAAMNAAEAAQETRGALSYSTEELDAMRSEPARKSRSTLRREAIQRGEPMPTFEAEPARKAPPGFAPHGRDPLTGGVARDATGELARKAVCRTCGGRGEIDARSMQDPLGSAPCPECAPIRADA